MSYEFQSQLFDTARDMLNAVAYEWMTAGGRNDAQDTDAFCARNSAESAASACIADFGLDQPENDDRDTWMVERGIDESDVVEAFKRFYATRPDRK